MRILTTDDPNADGDLEYPNPPAPTGITLTPRIRPHHHVRSPIKIRWEAVDDAPAYRVRYRKDGGTAWVNPNRQPRAAHPWPNMHDAEPGPQPQRPPPPPQESASKSSKRTNGTRSRWPPARTHRAAAPAHGRPASTRPQDERTRPQTTIRKTAPSTEWGRAT